MGVVEREIEELKARIAELEGEIERIRMANCDRSYEKIVQEGLFIEDEILKDKLKKIKTGIVKMSLLDYRNLRWVLGNDDRAEWRTQWLIADALANCFVCKILLEKSIERGFGIPYSRVACIKPKGSCSTCEIYLLNEKEKD